MAYPTPTFQSPIAGALTEDGKSIWVHFKDFRPPTRLIEIVRIDFVDLTKQSEPFRDLFSVISEGGTGGGNAYLVNAAGTHTGSDNTEHVALRQSPVKFTGWVFIDKDGLHYAFDLDVYHHHSNTAPDPDLDL